MTDSRTVEVVSPGAHTTIQDTGRPGYLSRGIPPSGGQDNYSLRLANRCVGNAIGQPLLSLGDPGDAGLEITLNGPKLRFHQAAVVAVTGADFPVSIDGRPVRMWEALSVGAGSELSIGTARSGLRGYVAVAGGFDVPSWLGSRATYIRGGQGGLDGRALRRGDLLGILPATRKLEQLAGAMIPERVRPAFDGEPELRVTLGPQDHLMTEESVAAFFAASWRLSPTSDRMGFRVNGIEIEFKPRSEQLVREAGALPSNVVLDVTPVGGIQITSGTEAIVMGVEAPSLGGYAKIGTVASADLDRLGQIRPGQSLRFRVSSVEEAIEIGVSRSRIPEAIDCHRPVAD